MRKESSLTVISIKIPMKMLEEIDRAVMEEGFKSRSEFIRTAIRELLAKIEELRLRRALRRGKSL